ncbi:protein of unknown function [Nocardioides alpinus]|nr:protein of unknown function [Nocardioides alpinus]
MTPATTTATVTEHAYVEGSATDRPRDARRAAVALAVASGLAIAGFTVLGAVFEYPQILEEPTADVLALFREHQSAVRVWFGVLVVGAALMAPAAFWLGRVVGGTLGRAIAVTGIGAAVVQVIGLQRWVTLIPGVARDALDPSRRVAAEERFELLHTVLGKVIGETVGYALTATFTVLVALALHRTVLRPWLTRLGYVAGALIATGVVIPFVEPASLTNFGGYVLWCLWLLLVAGVLVRRADDFVDEPTVVADVVTSPPTAGASPARR